MKRNIIIFTVLAFTCLSSECLAQQVVTQTVAGYTYNAVIDNATLPLKAIKKKSVFDGQKKDNGQMKSHNEDNEINEKVSPSFAVAKANMLGMMKGSDASTACKDYAEGDAKYNVWRLPTQRELMLIYQMKTELEASTDFTSFTTDYYWSSTSNNFWFVWSVDFDNGDVGGVDIEDEGHTVRCVRDL